MPQPKTRSGALGVVTACFRSSRGTLQILGTTCKLVPTVTIDDLECCTIGTEIELFTWVQVTAKVVAQQAINSKKGVRGIGGISAVDGVRVLVFAALAPMFDKGRYGERRLFARFYFAD